MIKLIALDIDGTILDSKKQISQTTKDAVQAAMDAGIKIIIASGRPYSGVEEYAKELGLYEKGGYILSFNGGQIMDCQTGEIVYDVYLEDANKDRICEILKEYDEAILMTYKGRQLLSENVDDEGVVLGAIHNRLELCKVADLRQSIEHRVCKFVMGGHPEYIKNIASDIQDKLGDMATVCRSESTLLEIMPYGVDKGGALAGLVEKLGYLPGELMACGDGYNDDTMLKYAGIGVAMGNAFDEIKELADYVTKTNDEDGVAYAIRKFALKQIVD